MELTKENYEMYQTVDENADRFKNLVDLRIQYIIMCAHEKMGKPNDFDWWDWDHMEDGGKAPFKWISQCYHDNIIEYNVASKLSHIDCGVYEDGKINIYDLLGGCPYEWLFLSEFDLDRLIDEGIILAKEKREQALKRKN